MSVTSIPTPSVRTARSPLQVVMGSWSGRIGLALLVLLFRNKSSINVDELNALKG